MGAIDATNCVPVTPACVNILKPNSTSQNYDMTCEYWCCPGVYPNMPTYAVNDCVDSTPDGCCLGQGILIYNPAQCPAVYQSPPGN
jgi:hypothetical protein